VASAAVALPEAGEPMHGRNFCSRILGIVAPALPTGEISDAMLLTEYDKKAIAEAVQKAELGTSGEIVFALTDASGHYHHADLQGALAGSIIATAVYLMLPTPQTIGMVIWIELISFALFRALIPRLPLRRWFISSREMDESVHEAAFREFYASGLYKTRELNGVLIYLSCLERRVVVLADRGIHEKMGNPHWNDVRDKIIQGIRQGKPREGICAAIETCGKALAAHFPRRTDDSNELPDEVIDRKKLGTLPGSADDYSGMRPPRDA